ncbi:hypothetical protein IPC1057_27320 [Pseudomonas aeruginosa]|nr:hypothetical protein IPC1289_25725 [Pseudomonas aeruginosa]RPR33418.1 hypothetical protein IPC1057_27320 [Pseudomonas aeruginosa]RQI09917.1 hypothetical protein IPC23_24215 [Pseudomonas aeruginosa]TQF92440.1 hypothetical protein FLM99_24015 [Pseudomonas aeruginosa]TQH25452.1 hypothetical protein FLI64_24285 [Pseudomonas aeruginosa]
MGYACGGFLSGVCHPSGERGGSRSVYGGVIMAPEYRRVFFGLRTRRSRAANRRGAPRGLRA